MSVLLAALEEEVQRGVDEHDKEVQHQRDGKQRLPLQARRRRTFRSPRPLSESARSQRASACSARCPLTIMTAIASPMARPTPSTTAAAMPLLRRRDGHAEPRLHRRRAERERRVLILLRYGLERRDRDLDDRRQDHDRRARSSPRAGSRRPARRIASGCRGTSTSIPTRPYTTDGMPASRLTADPTAPP